MNFSHVLISQNKIPKDQCLFAIVQECYLCLYDKTFNPKKSFKAVYTS